LAQGEGWSCNTKAHKLRLAIPSPSLEVAPISSPVTASSFIHGVDIGSVQRRQSTDSATEVLPPNQFALTPSTPNNGVDNHSPRNSTTTPMLTTPSPGCIRRQKMDRLRKKFGSGVPLDLVFPKISSEASEYSPATPPPSGGPRSNAKAQPHMPQMPVTDPKQEAKTAAGRFKNTRSRTISLSDAIATSVRHARSQSFDSPPSLKVDVRQVRPRSAPAANGQKPNGRLSLIMESPEEHRINHMDNGGLEHSPSHSSSVNETDSGLECFLASTSAKSLIDEGWHTNPVRTAFDHEICPTTGLSIGSQLLKRPATAPSAVSRSASWDPSGDSPPVEIKRRPSSYRKPPPPIPADLIC
jgi:hypothetical protein